MSDEELHNPHDRFFKRTFGRLKEAAEFFREYLPERLAAHLSWSELERIEKSFVDETFSERHADLLFRVPWKENELFCECAWNT